MRLARPPCRLVTERVRVIPASWRIEDAALLTGCGRFGDDLPVRADTLQATILRSPHPHAEIRSIDARAALALPGVAGILTAVCAAPTTSAKASRPSTLNGNLVPGGINR